MSAEPGHFLAGKKIIVSGAGIAGLAFTVALRKQWSSSASQIPDITIYDRDTREAGITREGNSLNLNGFDKDGGLVALKDLGVLDEILERAVLALEETGSFKTWAADWTELITVRAKPYSGLPTSSIRIARKELRRILIEAAEAAAPGAIRWETSCTSAEHLANGRIRVRTSSSSEQGGGEVEASEECDLLVVADGAHSKVRAALRPDDRLQYAGVIQLGGSARFPGGIPAPLHDSWGLVLAGEGICCFFSPVDKERVLWALSRLEAQPGLEPAARRTWTGEEFRALIAEALRLGHAIQEPFRTIVEATEESGAFLMPIRDKIPFAHDGSLAGGGVVFIGDANHAVTPFAGNGANMALKDGWDLAAAICTAPSLEATVAVYDSISVPRATASLKTSRWRIYWGHSTGIRQALYRAFLWVGTWILWMKG